MPATFATSPTGPTFACPKCGRANPESAQFCLGCHTILIHRCPNCWHEQRSGIICEKCQTNIPLYMEMAVERSLDEESRLERAKVAADAGSFLQLLMLPFSGLVGVLRVLLARAAALFISLFISRR